MLPVLTIIGLGLAGLVAGLVVVETVFAVPGLGRLVGDGAALRLPPTQRLEAPILPLQSLSPECSTRGDLYSVATASVKSGAPKGLVLSEIPPRFRATVGR